MKIIDRYIAKQLLIPILFCSMTLIFLVFVADIFDYLDEMVRHKTSLSYILKYYFLLIPETFVGTISWACLLATLYVLTSFNYHNEIVAMKVAGLEITSIIRPIIFIGFCIGIFSFLVSDQIVPRKNEAFLNMSPITAAKTGFITPARLMAKKKKWKISLSFGSIQTGT
jgi:lipopolysaccharide export system permease protein